MPNTATDNELAITAYKAIASKYAAHFHMNPSVGGLTKALMYRTGVENYVKFMDHDAFMTNLSLNGPKKAANCMICGFTAPVLGKRFEREMYINRRYANASTVIHEMLHFLTHPQFWSFVGPIIAESVTEYFTRKVIAGAKSEKFSMDQRKGRYDTHHQLLQFGRQGVKVDGTRPQKGYMKAAYFQGDHAAIAFIKTNFRDLEVMLKQDE
jgi:hypothetical protein